MTNNWHGVLAKKDLMVGDTLIRADWSYSSGEWNETAWKVMKILNTRVVIERTHDNGQISTVRLIMNGPRGYRPGEINGRFEGQSEWSRTRYYLFTPDDPELVKLRADLATAGARTRAADAALRAAQAFTRSREVEVARDAIAALTEYVVRMTEN